MSAALHKETQVYRNILTLLMLLAVVTVSGCLGLLWLRQKIETTAQATRSLEMEIEKEERRLRYVDTKIAEIHKPIFLETQIARLGLNLRPPQSDQVVFIQAFPQRNGVFAEARQGKENAERNPFRHSIDLAIMDALTPIE